jgi:hypothetical protein
MVVTLVRENDYLAFRVGGDTELDPLFFYS